MTASFSIRAIALDFDGVLTDGSVLWGPEGQEWKRLSFRDIMGVSLAGKAGLQFGIISGENSPLLERFAKKMNIRHVFPGSKDKAASFRELSVALCIPPDEIAYMGDDVNDLGAMQLAGLSAAPSDAHPDVIEGASFRSKFPGGNGAVRELVDHLLAGRKP
jgi:3-deoxy-D-manno-octulosonate 8-phosphate phosphatase (KDO 8-P phosphatase)